MRRLLLFVLLAVTWLASCAPSPAPLPDTPRVVDPADCLTRRRAAGRPTTLPAPIDLLTGRPVRGVTIRADERGGWLRLTFEAPGYVRKFKWVAWNEPPPATVVLAPAAVDRYADEAWKNPNGPRLIMLGFDGMTESLFRATLNRGEMPAFEVMLQNGTWGPIQSCCSTISPSVWTTIYTGLTPEQHGVTDFLGRDPVTGALTALTFNDIRAPRLWEILRSAGQKSLIFGGLLMDPAINLFGPTNDVADKLRLFRRALAVERPRLAVVYEEEADHAGHQWWAASDPDSFRANGWPITDESALFDGQRIAQAYRNLDAWVATALQSAGPQTVILVNSDHGMRGMAQTPPVIADAESFVRMVAAPAFQACDIGQINDIVLCADPVLDVRPLARQLREARLADGEVPFAEVFDRDSTPGLDTYSPAVAIRIVLAGANLQRALQAGQKLSIAGREVPLADFLRVNPSSGGHDEYGLFFIAGAGITHNAVVANATVYDLMPTALAVLGLPAARDMPGRVWNEVFDQPPTAPRVASYGRFTPGGTRPKATPAELRHLRELGYIN